MLQHHLREMKILIINSGSLDLLLLQDILASDGYLHHKGFIDAALMPSLLSDFAPDLVVLGAAPQRETFEMLGQLRSTLGHNDFLPVLVVAQNSDSSFKRRALDVGATDFLHLPLDHTEVLLRVHNLLYARNLHVRLSRFCHNHENNSRPHKSIKKPMDEEPASFHTAQLLMLEMNIVCRELRNFIKSFRLTLNSRAL